MSDTPDSGEARALAPSSDAPVALRRRFRKEVGDTNLRSKLRTKVRQQLMTELSIRGWSQGDIAKQFGLSTKQVKATLLAADRNGVAEDIRQQMLETLLPLSKQVYEEVLTTPAADLKEHVKAHELKLKAARQVTDRFIAPKPPTRTEGVNAKVTMTYEEFMRVRASRALPDSQQAAGQFRGEIVDGILVPVEADGAHRDGQYFDRRLSGHSDGDPAEGDADVAGQFSGDDADPAGSEVDGTERGSSDQGRALGAGGSPDEAPPAGRAVVHQIVEGAAVDAEDDGA